MNVSRRGLRDSHPRRYIEPDSWQTSTPNNRCPWARPAPPAGKLEACFVEPVHNSSPDTLSCAPENALDVSRVMHWSCRLPKHRISTHSCRQLSAVVNGMPPSGIDHSSPGSRVPSERTNSNPNTSEMGVLMNSKAYSHTKVARPNYGGQLSQISFSAMLGGGHDP